MNNNNENFQPLDSVKHADLRVKTGQGCQHLKNINNAFIVAEEVAEMAANCPVVFLKDAESGSFQLSALFGLLQKENLLVSEQGKWLGSYIPVSLNLAPFGFFLGSENDDDRIRIDLDSPCVSTKDGEKLFERGQASPFLKDMYEQLELVIDATIQTEKLIENLVNRNLLTECKLILEKGNAQPVVIGDLYTINISEFSYMTDEDVVMFHKLGYWSPIYAIQQSINQLKNLVNIRNLNNPDDIIKLTVHIDRDE